MSQDGLSPARAGKTLTRQIVQYMVAGGAFFWSGYLAFAILDSVLGLPLFVAKQGANIIGLTINYILQDRWVFDHTSTHSQRELRSGKYVVITLVNFGIDYLIVSTLKDRGVSPYIGQFVSAGFFTFWNFFWYKYWVFAPSGKRRS